MTTFTKIITEGNTNYKMNVVVKMSKTNHEYFSITYEQITMRGRLESCGAGHDTIRKYFGTDFDDVIPLHLADSDGVPIYALENGFYYLRNPEEFKPEAVANHFRVSLGFVEALRVLSKDELAKWIEDQKPRWKAEAEAIRTKYKI
jgi:hypothetical protein